MREGSVACGSSSALPGHGDPSRCTRDNDQLEPAEQNSSEAIGLDGEVGGEVVVGRGEGAELLAQLDESLDLIAAELVDGFVIVPGDVIRVNDSGRGEDFDVGLLWCGLLRRGFLCR